MRQRVTVLCAAACARLLCIAAPGAEGGGGAEEAFDLVVVGGTPGGIACAVRGARDGLRVLLVNRHAHLGGMLSSGLGVWDTLYEGRRAPIYDEVRAAIIEHYRANYGAGSAQHRDALPGPSGYTNGRFEPRVAEKILDALVAREKGLAVLRGFVAESVEREDALLRVLVLKAVEGGLRRRVSGRVFADATYEGDLVAIAGAPFRVGRESRGEHGEPHAGTVFMRPVSAPPDANAKRLVALHEELKLRKFSGWQEVMPESTGAADPAVQACNYRTILTADPDNRVAVAKPAHYDPYFLKSLEIFSGVSSIPNGKFGWNRPQIVGRQTGYVEGDWAERRRIEEEHWEATLGLLYFLQNDLTVPEIVRRAWQAYGLARDEFADNGHRPHEMYVREGRRLAGRAVFTEHDATLAAGTERCPVHADSIAMTEWYLDCHSCTTARVAGGLEEGKMMLFHETFPGQIPYRCLLPKGVDNLLVPVCLSATHVAWGTVRLEPVWMQTGEAAGAAAALALKRGVAPAALDADALVRRLCELRSMVCFFNDVDVSSDESWVLAAEYFGTKGFFHGYDARVNDGLTREMARTWARGFAGLMRKEQDPNALARAVAEAERSGGAGVSEAAFVAMLPAFRSERSVESGGVLSRGGALELMYSLLP